MAWYTYESLGRMSVHKTERSETHSDRRQDGIVVALLSFQEPSKGPVR
jgi:hypothetical protein